MSLKQNRLVSLSNQIVDGYDLPIRVGDCTGLGALGRDRSADAVHLLCCV